MDPIEQIAAAVLYEGYVLWPYRRSALKNQQRWTFGGVYPPAYSAMQAGSDACRVQTECLVRGEAPVLAVTVRFLQAVERQAFRVMPDGQRQAVDTLRVGGERYLTWEEATEREVRVAMLALGELRAGKRVPIHVAAGSAEEPLALASGEVAGALVRRWGALEGTVEIAATPVGDQLVKVTVGIRNDSSWEGHDRASALTQTLLAAHALLRVAGGAFVSLMDPPPALKAEVEACENIKLWPVLVGEEGDTHAMLAAPIILYDFPRIAPESPGDLFDATEIDQLLIMSILSLSDEEKAEMRATDPRTRAILERSEALTPQDVLRLQGAIRELQVPRAEGSLSALWGELEAPGPPSVTVRGVEVHSGSRVRLRPQAGGDIMDIALAGEVAIVEAIEQDYEGTVHLAVTVESDPGRDLGRERQIGHRFFFTPDEVEPLDLEPPMGGAL